MYTIMRMLLILWAGSALFALVRPQILLASMNNVFWKRLQFSLTFMTTRSGLCAKNASNFITSSVLLKAQRNLKRKLIGKASLFALLWGVDIEIYRYAYRYMQAVQKFGYFRMPKREKKTPLKRGLPVNQPKKKRKHSPSSSHKGGKIGQYTQQQLDDAKILWEESLAKGPNEAKMSLRDIADATGLTLGTLNKRTTGKLPWIKNVGGRRTPRVLTRGMYWLRVLVACIGCVYRLHRIGRGACVSLGLQPNFYSLFSRRGRRPC